MPLPSDDVPEAVWTIVVAGGSGQRFGKPKQFEELGGRRVLDWAVAAASDASDGVVLVLPAANVDRSNPLEVAGGATRSESVRNGLAAVPENATVVCVHDAARPFASSRVFAAVIGAVAGGADAAVPGVPVVDTITGPLTLAGEPVVYQGWEEVMPLPEALYPWALSP